MRVVRLLEKFFDSGFWDFGACKHCYTEADKILLPLKGLMRDDLI